MKTLQLREDGSDAHLIKIQGDRIEFMKNIAFLLCSLLAVIPQAFSVENVTITYVKDATEKGAVCLDGSPAAYSLKPGFGNGAKNWIVFLEGGAWCASVPGCLQRIGKDIGSTITRNSSRFGEILDDVPAYNPDFYNWNKVFVRYCDGGSFAGDVEEVDTKNNLTMRGARIFNAVMDELLSKGMKNAENAILAGSSAGGLAVYLHCDIFRELIPSTQRVKCIADSGLFFYGEKLLGAETRKDYNRQLLEFHRMLKFLPQSCTSRMDPAMCIFPENLIDDIKTPIFILEAGFDWWKIQFRYIPVADKPVWKPSNCFNDLTNCTDWQLNMFQDFRRATVETLQKLGSSSSRGLFVNNCYGHGHITIYPAMWRCKHVAGNTTVAKMISDWYFDRSTTNLIMPPGRPQNCSATQEEYDKCVLDFTLM